MNQILQIAIPADSIRSTSGHKHIMAFRLVAGAPLLMFGVMHFIDPASFRAILQATGIPMVEVNMIAAPLAEIVAGFMLLLGVFARIGGLLGIATMLPAIYATVVLAGTNESQLPAGLTQIPEVPPLPLPVIVLLASAYVLWRGAGAWSMDSKRG